MAKVDLDPADRAILIESTEALEESYSRDLNRILQDPALTHATKRLVQDAMGPMISRAEDIRTRLGKVKER